MREVKDFCVQQKWHRGTAWFGDKQVWFFVLFLFEGVGGVGVMLLAASRDLLHESPPPPLK